MQKQFIIPQDAVSKKTKKHLLYCDDKLVKHITDNDCRKEMRKITITMFDSFNESDINTIISAIEKSQKLKHNGSPKNRKEQMQLLTSLLKYAEKYTKHRINVSIQTSQGLLEMNYGRYSAYVSIAGQKKILKASIRPVLEIMQTQERSH